jgi:phospholipid-binding lipoprotein MlaA
MPLNRGIFAFNDVVYRYALIPFARAYNTVLPSPVRTSVGNFFDNIKAPIPIVNHLLQGQGRQAMVEVARFGVNSTVGVLGLFDPATSWLELERQATGFDDTLRQYDVGYGVYIVMPFAGPSNLRAGGSTFVDAMLNPIAHVFNEPESTGLRIFDNVQEFTPQAEAYLELRENSEDLYIFMRNAHLQSIQRDADYR